MHAGAPLHRARAAAILMHGRERDPADILGVADRLGLEDLAYLAPAAHGNSWYPNRFMAPLAENQPCLDQALAVIDRLIADTGSQGLDQSQVVLLGFSQGACLISEYAVRHARRYCAVVAFTGGLIGPEGTLWNYGGDFAGTPVFLGTSDVDEWVPADRVRESAAVFQRMGAAVELKIYRGMEHAVTDDEIACARRIIMSGL
jgi:phospholipase/carboxylesterase